jgi:hypothetical protein
VRRQGSLSPVHARTASDTVNPSPLSQTHFRNPTVEDIPDENSSSTSTSIAYDSPSEDPRRTQILAELSHQMANWSLDPSSQSPSRDDRRNSSSTIPVPSESQPLPLSSIQRHQRQTSNMSARAPLTTDELRYLAYVVEALATLVIASALSEDGVQYRNTFAWKFVVHPRPSSPLPSCLPPQHISPLWQHPWSLLR